MTAPPTKAAALDLVAQTILSVLARQNTPAEAEKAPKSRRRAGAA